MAYIYIMSLTKIIDKLKEYPYLIAVLYLPLSYRLIAMFNLHFQPNRIVNSTTSLDIEFFKLLPYNSIFVAFYLFYFVCLLFPLILKKDKQWEILIKILIVSSIAHIFFLTIPTSVDRFTLEQMANLSWDNHLLRLIYENDLNVNCFPTLHAAHVVLLSMAFNKKEFHPAILILFKIIAFYISLSTIVLKQHSVIDVVGAVILAVAVTKVCDYYFKKRREKASSVQ